MMHKFSLTSRAFFHHGFALSMRCAYPRPLPLLVDTAAGPPIIDARFERSTNPSEEEVEDRREPREGEQQIFERDRR